MKNTLEIQIEKRANLVLVLEQLTKDLNSKKEKAIGHFQAAKNILK